MRFWRSPTTLRSNQIISIVATSRKAKATTTFSSDDQDDGEVDLPGEERITAEHRVASGRLDRGTAVDGAVAPPVDGSAHRTRPR